MKKILLLLSAIISMAGVYSQNVWVASDATYDATATGYTTVANPGIYYRATTGGTSTFSTGTGCNGSTSTVQMSSSTFIFKATSLNVASIIIHGNSGTGSSRTLSAITTSATLNGTYVANASTASGNLSGTQATNFCSPAPMTITFGTAIPAGTFIKVVLSGNAYVATITLNASGTAPTVTTASPVSSGRTSGTGGGNITDGGSSAVTASGLCFGTATNPTLSNGVVSTSPVTTTGAFSSLAMTGLTAGTLYHVRAYATSIIGTSYGSDVTFTTDAPILSTLSTTAITGTTAVSASSGGSISDTGGAVISAKGVCWSTSSGPTTALATKTSDGTGSANFVSSITGLTPNTLYYVRAYATSAAGTAYGDEKSFTTQVAVPTITVAPASLSFGDVPVNYDSIKPYILSAQFLNTATGDIVVTAPSGYLVSLSAGSGYASSINVPYTAATLAATNIYVKFTPTAANAYSGSISNVGGGDSKSVSLTGNGATYTAGDFLSANAASASWETVSTWRNWNGTAIVAAAAIPNATTANVFITRGTTVTYPTGGRSMNNLVVNGTLTTTAVVTSPSYLSIAGNITVNTGGVIGSAVNQTGDNSSGISISTIGTGTQTISGGGNIYISRLRLNSANEVIVDNDITVNYHGSANGGNASALYPVQTGSTLTINAGKTITMARWAGIYLNTGSGTLYAYNFTMNVNGSLIFESGSPADANDKTLLKGYLLCNATTGNTFTINVGSAGVMTLNDYYPNGTSNTGTSTGASTLTIANGGIVNVKLLADFSRGANQTVTGAGAFNLVGAAAIRIASADGIAASGASGHVQTTTRSFPTTANYAYQGTAAQVTGNGLPATVASLTINNTAGVALSGNVAALDSLKLIAGKLATGNNTVSTNAVKGGSASSYVLTNGSGTLKINAVGASPVTFPVGPTDALYNPVIIANSGTTDNFAAGCGIVAPNFIGGTGPSINAAWYIAEDVPGGTNATITTQWDVSQEPGGYFRTNAFLYHSDGYGATFVGPTTDISGQAGPAFTITASGFTEFSPFGVGSTPSILPITLEHFKGTKTTSGNAINWKVNCTSARINMEIERSADARKFSSIYTITADQVRCSQPFDMVDAHPLKGTNYYRLKMTDMDGKVTYSAVIAIINADKGIEIIGMYPTVTNSSAFLSVSAAKAGKIQTVITDMSGRIIRTNTDLVAEGSSLISIDCSALAAGVYQVTGYVDGAVSKTIRFIKQ